MFFSAWELKGRFPQILEHPEIGQAARELYAEGTALLDRIEKESLLTPQGVFGFWPANREGDDVVLFEDESRTKELARFPMLRQQAVKPGEQPYYSLADFVAPKGHADYVGAFAVTSGIGAEELAKKFEGAHDDYHAILVKALADRLAEAFAEYLHAHARKVWGYGHDEALSHEDLVRERYRGIRPAFGYPACPDHTEKRTLFALLDAEKVGIELTEHCAMYPTASVSGLYFGHPESRYFAVGQLARDQVVDYARRKGMSLAEAERWLAPNLGYDPEAVTDAVAAAE
jgi:5-methyltetrahydrofolate--homocysteine methyltransferase